MLGTGNTKKCKYSQLVISILLLLQALCDNGCFLFMRMVTQMTCHRFCCFLGKKIMQNKNMGIGTSYREFSL